MMKFFATVEATCELVLSSENTLLICSDTLSKKEGRGILELIVESLDVLRPAGYLPLMLFLAAAALRWAISRRLCIRYIILRSRGELDVCIVFDRFGTLTVGFSTVLGLRLIASAC